MDNEFAEVVHDFLTRSHYGAPVRHVDLDIFYCDNDVQEKLLKDISGVVTLRMPCASGENIYRLLTLGDGGNYCPSLEFFESKSSPCGDENACEAFAGFLS